MFNLFARFNVLLEVMFYVYQRKIMKILLQRWFIENEPTKLLYAHPL